MRLNLLRKLSICAALGLLAGWTTTVRAQFAPIVLNPNSFNQDMVVEKTAPTPVIPGGYSTASMDGGTNNTGDTWNEVGYFPNNPDVGLPAAGSTFTSVSSANHQYTLAPSYTTNDAVMLDATAVFSHATLALKTPASFGALSFLTSGGNGGCIFSYTVHHVDGSTETGSTPSADWFNGANPAWIANGRVNAQTFTLDNLGSNNPRLYGKDVSLTNTASAITSIDVAYVSSASGAHTCIMAVSGSSAISGAFSPILVTGYNADIVVEATATQAHPLVNASTATMDGGTANTGTTWYEQGFDPAALSTGLPAPGATLTNVSSPDHHYVMAPTYAGNNTILLDPSLPSVTLTPIAPAAFSGLSLLSASANGGVTVGYEVHHADQSIETGSVVTKDWFGNTPVAFTANGRVNLDTGTLANVNSGNPRLYSADFALTNTVSPVTSIILSFVDGGATARAVVFAVSGSGGPVSPTFSVQPVTVKISPGGAVTLSATAGGTAPITYRWQHGVNGVFTNITDSANITGSSTAQLNIASASDSEAGDYRVVATNGGGSATSDIATVTVLSSLTSVTVPTDLVNAYGGTSPAAEDVTHVIDQATDKYLNFGANGGAPFKGPAGFSVSPAMGRTIVKAVQFYTANDAPERDPADYKLEGSNDGGASYAVIATGSLSLPTQRNAAGAALDPVGEALQQVTFTNNTGYTTYRVSFNNVRDNVAANSMQIGEVALLGVLDTSGAPAITTQPQPVTVTAGSTAQFTAAATGTPSPTFRWLKGTNGVYSPLSDSGNVSGTGTGTLVIQNASFNDVGNYIAVASSSSGSVTSAVVRLTVISTLQDVTAPGDIITAFGDQSGTIAGTAADPANAIDDTTTPYINGGSGFSASAGFPPFSGPVGLEITPVKGSTVVTGLRVYAGPGNPERDPIDYKLEGSNNGGTNYTLISSGSLSLPGTRNATGLTLDPLTQAPQEVLFSNNGAYTTYRVTFTNVADPTKANSLEIAEIELLGTASTGTSGPTLSIRRETNGSLTITSSQPGTLQSTTALNGANTVWVSEGAITGSKTVTATGLAKFYRLAP